MGLRIQMLWVRVYGKACGLGAGKSEYDVLRKNGDYKGLHREGNL
jgi:hypothetical protein